MRSCGVLFHITSLPSRFGVGTLGQVAPFIRFLKKAKQSYWQILPVTPTDFVNSPYASPSAFAGNTLLIDVSDLHKQGLLSSRTLKNCSKKRGNDYGYAKSNKEIMLREAYSVFSTRPLPSDFEQFCRQNEYWLNDYALFCALKGHFDGKSWLEWDDEDIRMRKPSALKHYAEALADEVSYNVFCQYVFFSQWKKFRAKLGRAGLKLIGDIPIYVAYDSADVWAHPQFFKLTEDRRPSWVAGVPPDYFSADGQLWGNPIYDWAAMKQDGYSWWTARVTKCAELFDVLRIDHFRAFDSYYEIAYGQTTARVGTWREGVGYEFLQLIQNAVPQLTVIAEDLGDIPQSVLDLRDKCGLAGMKVVQFAFDGNPKNSFLPCNFEEHCVAYLGTHDNDTTRGWWESLGRSERETVLKMIDLCQKPDHAAEKYLPNVGASDENDAQNDYKDVRIVPKLIEILAESRAELVVICLQDLVEADTSQRMNTPGTLGCWKYMAKRSDFSDEVAVRLAELTQKANRA